MNEKWMNRGQKFYLYGILGAAGTCLTLLLAFRLFDSMDLLLVMALFGLFMVTICFSVHEMKQEEKILLHRAEMEAQVAQAELREKKQQLLALQSQINPHFLYNTLDTFRGVAIENGNRELCDMIEALSAMFKYSVNYDTEMVPVNAELEYLSKYMQLQQLRFPGRFEYKEEIRCTPDQLLLEMCPRFVLQPVAENAIRHGLRSVRKGGRITVIMEIRQEDFYIMVEDNGVGMDGEQLEKLNRRLSLPESEEGEEEPGHGIGMRNVNKRIKMYCGEAYGIHVDSTLQKGTCVEIRLPLYREAHGK